MEERPARSLRVKPRLVTALRFLLIASGPLPFLPGWLEAHHALPWLSRWLEAWFDFQCSRSPNRMLFDAAVCARCLGIYAGLGLGALLLRPKLAPLPLRIWVGAAALVMVLDVASETLGMRPPAPGFRLFTGILLAYPVGLGLILELRAWAQKPRTIPSDG